MYDIVIIGDSISSGYGVSQSRNWVSLLKKNINCTVNINNLSTQGATSFDGVDIVQNFYQSNKAKLMVLELGGNDALRGMNLDDTFNNLGQIIKSANKNKTLVVLVSVELPTNYGRIYNKKIKKMYTSLSDKYLLTQVHLNYPNDSKLVQEDRIHPTESGHQLIAQSLLTPLEKIICT